MQSTVFLVEDNIDFQEMVQENLESDGYIVIPSSTARELTENLQKHTPDIILLDIMLPDANGLTLMEKIREVTDAPVIVISGKGDMVDKVVGLEMGADDYLGKPFEMRELTARIKANVRRYRGQSGTAAAVNAQAQADKKRIKFGSWVLDPAKYQLFDDHGKSADLTVREFRLLHALLMSSNQVLSREQLLNKARENDFEVYDRAIDVQITRIRKKIEIDPQQPELIKTVRGAGYMLLADPETLE